MNLNDFCLFLESLAPLSTSEEYDNAGLLVGDPDMTVRKVMLCLDLTPAVMDEATAKDCNLIISHHPFIFTNLKRLTWDKVETKLIYQAVKRDMAIYAIHTNLDNALNGLNGYLMKKLGISSFKILLPKKDILSKLITFCPLAYAEKTRNALFEAGAGTIGNYNSCSFNTTGEGTFRASGEANPFVGQKNIVHFEKEVKIEVIFPNYLEGHIIKALLENHPYEEVAYDIVPLRNPFPKVGAGTIGELTNPMTNTELLLHIKNTLTLNAIRHSGLLSRPVKRVACCSGSGSFLISEAIRAGADVLITADLKYHDFFLGADRITLMDIGHYESEHWVKEWLYHAIIEKFPTFAVLISEINTNPVHYF